MNKLFLIIFLWLYTFSTYAAPNNDPIYITLSTEKTSAHVGEQILLTLKIYHQVDILDGSLSDLTANNAIIQPLNDKKIYVTKIDQTFYKVIEQHYALFAQSNGIETVAPIQLDATIAQPNTQQQPDDFFAPLNQINQKQIRVRSNQLELLIKPKPVGYPVSAFWFPTSELKVSSNLTPDVGKLNSPQLKVGDPITQVISISAKGVQGSSLPDLKINPPEGLNNYSDQPQIKDIINDAGVLGRKIQSIAWVPMHSGQFKIPNQSIDWWNTQKNRLEHYDIPGQIIQVMAASDTPSEIAPSKILNNNTAIPQKPSITAASITQSVNVWKIISIVLTLFIFLLASGLLYLLKRINQFKATTPKILVKKIRAIKNRETPLAPLYPDG